MQNSSFSCVRLQISIPLSTVWKSFMCIPSDIIRQLFCFFWMLGGLRIPVSRKCHPLLEIWMWKRFPSCQAPHSLLPRTIKSSLVDAVCFNHSRKCCFPLSTQSTHVLCDGVGRTFQWETRHQSLWIVLPVVHCASTSLKASSWSANKEFGRGELYCGIFVAQ